jgi:hypothetical protein
MDLEYDIEFSYRRTVRVAVVVVHVDVWDSRKRLSLPAGRGGEGHFSSFESFNNRHKTNSAPAIL